MKSEDADNKRPAVVIPFPTSRPTRNKPSSNTKRDNMIIEYFERRLAHERRARSGLMSDLEVVEEHMILNAEMFVIAKKFNL